MGQENHKRSSPGGLPTSTGRSRGNALPRGRQIQKTFNNIKITILCGFVTILVLRGTIGVNLGSSDADVVNQNLIEETNRIIAEIRSDADPSDPGEETFFNPNATFTLGPKITNWDQERNAWLNQNPEYPNFVKDCKHGFPNFFQEKVKERKAA